MAPLGLTNTGADPAAEWSPEHIGEPEEDVPLFTIIRHVVAVASNVAHANTEAPALTIGDAFARQAR